MFSDIKYKEKLEEDDPEDDGFDNAFQMPP